MAVGLKSDKLVFEFPEIHKDAVLEIHFERTLRIPDDGKDYGLPPGLGAFPLLSVDDVPADRLPGHWPKRGGVVMPMHQSEATWLKFSSPTGYHFAVKVGIGKVCAITGKEWSEDLNFARDGKGQDFVEVPKQKWLDGICVKAGVIKQFVAMPLDTHGDYTVEKQVTGKAEVGGVQILVFPLKASAWESEKAKRAALRPRSFSPASGYDGGLESFGAQSFAAAPMYAAGAKGLLRCASVKSATPRMAPDMGMGAGGRMKQEIYEATHGADQWEGRAAATRCFVALANSLCWRALTGKEPPTLPWTAKDYAAKGYPWYEWYAEGPVLDGSEALSKVKSVAELSAEKGEAVLPENEGFDPAAATTVKLTHLPRSGAPVLAEGSF